MYYLYYFDYDIQHLHDKTRSVKIAIDVISERIQENEEC